MTDAAALSERTPEVLAQLVPSTVVTVETDVAHGHRRQHHALAR